MQINRREFLRISGAGAMTLFLSGCGLSALLGSEENKAAGTIPEKGSISGGKAEYACIMFRIWFIRKHIMKN